MLEKAHKFAALWEGPYTIERVYPNGNYILHGYNHNPVHGDRLREYSNRDSLIPEVGSQRQAQNIVYQKRREPHRIIQVFCHPSHTFFFSLFFLFQLNSYYMLYLSGED